MFSKIKSLFSKKKEIIIRYDQREVLRLRAVGDMDDLSWEAIANVAQQSIKNNPHTEHTTIEFVG